MSRGSSRKPQREKSKALTSAEAQDLQQRAEQFNHQLLASEDAYVNELETIIEYIIKPLERNAKRCKIQGGEKEVKKVFQYMHQMQHFHTEFLSLTRDTISIIPDLRKYISFIKTYDEYLHHYDQIIDIFATWRSMEFREFVTLRLKHDKVKKHIIDKLDSLPWYLYRPFDRIKEYHRFLKDIEKISRKGHGDYDLVKDTLSKIRPLYKKIKASLVWLSCSLSMYFTMYSLSLSVRFCGSLFLSSFLSLCGL